MHDDRCASLKGYPCNCASAAFRPKVQDSRSGTILPGAPVMIDRALKMHGEAAVMHAIPSRRQRRRAAAKRERNSND